jgi:ligand-binding sensor domain-containing protein
MVGRLASHKASFYKAGLVLLVLVVLLASGCQSASPQPGGAGPEVIDSTSSPASPTSTPVIPTTSPSPSPAIPTASPASPSPSPTISPANPTGPTSVPAALPSAEPTSPVVASAVPGPSHSDRVTYVGVNDVQDVSFALDGSLWVATTGGAAHWDLETDTYAQYGTADGLPSFYITGVAPSPDGSVWFATLGGVSRLSGSTWTTWSEADGLVSNTAQSIAVSADGEVWVGTTEGIGRFDGDRWTAYLAGTRAYDGAVAPNGDLWFAGHGAGAIRYEPGDDQWTMYNEADGQPLAGVTALDVGPDGSVWIYENWQGIYRLAAPVPSNPGEAQWERVQGQVAFVCAIAVAADGTPWLGTCGSMHSSFGNLMREQGGNWQEIEGWHELGKPPIRAIALGPGDAMAVGTDLGFAVRQGGAWRTLRGGPGRNEITAVAVMPDGDAWFGFGNDQSSPAGGGASRFDGETWQYSLDDANVRVLAVAPDGTLWAGAGCSVHQFDGGTWHEMAACGVLGPGNVIDLAFGPDGAVWAATGTSLNRWDGESWQDVGKMALSIAAAQDGTVWVSGWEGGEDSYYVAYYDGSEWTKVLDRLLASLTVMPDGSVWGLDGERGLVRFDGESWEPVAGADDSSAYGLLAVAPDGTLWLSGPAGLAHLDSGAWTSYSQQIEGVRSMAVAPDGSIWLGTGGGAVHFEPDQTSP